VDDLVVGEEPGEGGEGSHHPLEGHHRLFHVAVQEEDRRTRETEKRKKRFTFFISILLRYFLHMPKFGTFVMSKIVE